MKVQSVRTRALGLGVATDLANERPTDPFAAVLGQHVESSR